MLWIPTPAPWPLPSSGAHTTPRYMMAPIYGLLRSTHTMHHHVGLTRPEQPPSVSLSVPHLSLARVPRRRPHSHGRPCSCPNPSTGGRRALDLACGRVAGAAARERARRAGDAQPVTRPHAVEPIDERHRHRHRRQQWRQRRPRQRQALPDGDKGGRAHEASVAARVVDGVDEVGRFLCRDARGSQTLLGCRSGLG